jgi:HAD superfamily hydrolase (TIGR01458 family)
MALPETVRGVLFDLDGTISIGASPIPGAIATIEHLRSRNIARRYLTNTTTKSVDTLHRDLVNLGLPIAREEVMSSLTAGVAYLRTQGSPTCYLVLSADAKRDFAEFGQDEEQPDVVVVGDIGPLWTYDFLNRLFQMVMAGATILALHKGRFWQTPDGLRMDIGAFVAGLEYTTGQAAHVVGKPSAAFFQTALAGLGVDPAQAMMVGDDIESDVGGAQRAGLAGVLVRTGKFREELVAASTVEPDLILDSVADLSAALDLA